MNPPGHPPGHPIDDALRDEFRRRGGLAGLAALLGPEAAAIGATGLEDREDGADDAAEAADLVTTERRVAGRVTPFFGRREALESLYNAVRDAVLERQARSVSIIGGAGLGKTRLFAETLAIINPGERNIDVLALAARHDEGSVGLMARIVRRRFAIEPRDHDTAAYDRILEAIEPYASPRELPHWARLLGFLAGLRAMGPGGDALPVDLDTFRRQALRTLVAVFKRDLERRPRILVIRRAERLHPHALDFLQGLASDLNESPFVLVTMADTGPASPPRTTAPSRVVRVSVTIDALSEREVERQARALLGDDAPQGIVDALVTSAQGSPRLLEENFLVLVQQGALRAEGDRVVATDVPMGALASTLEESSRARVDALAPDVREWLAAAAVFGGSFPALGASAVARALRIGAWYAPDDADRALFERAAEVGILHATADGWRFAHVDDRARIIDSWPAGRRALAHALAAQWLISSEATRATPTLAPEVLAHHWARAGRPDEAAKALVRAAAHAQAGLAHQRARALLTRALHVLGLHEVPHGLAHAAELGAVLGQLGALALRGGDFASAWVVYSAYLETSRALVGVQHQAAAWLGLGRASRGLGRYARARSAFAAAAEAFRTLNDSSGAAETLVDVARVFWLEGGDGGYAEALSRFEEALAVRRRLGSPRPIAETLAFMANIRIQHADRAAAQSALEEARRLYREVEDLAGEASCLLGLGALAFFERRLDEAIAIWREALRAAETGGERDLASAILDNLGEAYLEKGDDLEHAEAALLEAREIAAEGGDPRTYADILKNLALVTARRGDFARAATLIADAQETAERIGSRPVLGQVIRARGMVASLRNGPGDPAAADRAFGEALAIFAVLGDRAETDRTLLAKAAHEARRA